MMHLFNTNRAQTASYVGRVLVPGSVNALGNNGWHRLSATTGFGFTNSDRPDATEMRICLTYADSATSADAPLQVRLRRTDQAGGTVFFSDTWPITWSGSLLSHHRCGAWHSASSVSCGYSWANTCQVDWLHSLWVHVSIKSVELEFASSDPSKARFFRGRLDTPAAWDWNMAANTWHTISQSIGFVNSQYPDAKYIRACMVFVDNSQAGTARLRLFQTHTGHVEFEDGFGGTWSGNGLTHAKCGAWHTFSSVSCGFSWTTTCVLQIQTTLSYHFKVFEVDLELKSAALS